MRKYVGLFDSQFLFLFGPPANGGPEGANGGPEK